MSRATSVAIVTIGLLATACIDESGSGADVETVGKANSAVFVTTTSLAPATNVTTNVTTNVATNVATAPNTTAPVAPAVGSPIVQAINVGTFSEPVDLAIRPGDEALYIVEQSGHVVKLVNDTSTVVADVSDRITPGGEQGLLGLAFSPDATLAYLNYIDAAGDTVVAEYPVAVDGMIDVAAGRMLLNVEQPYANHNGGDLEFGPDEMLYVTLGDGGSADDPQRRASDTFDLLGKLLRIDPAPSANQEYTIPPDNPFADGVNGAPEVWAWGLRNPWKIAFDPTNGDLWIADVGQNLYEEINLVQSVDGAIAGRGANFGWSAYEGTDRFNEDIVDPGNLTIPLLTYEHGSDGCSVSGGVPYHGREIRELEPAYVYSDYCSGRLWAVDVVGQRNQQRGLSGEWHRACDRESHYPAT